MALVGELQQIGLEAKTAGGIKPGVETRDNFRRTTVMIVIRQDRHSR